MALEPRPHLRDAFVAKPRRSWAWMLPMLSALTLVGVFVAWLELSERKDREEAAATLISDSLSAAQHLRTQIDEDQSRVNEIARQLGDDSITAAGLASTPAVLNALRQRWQSLTLIDHTGQVLVNLPDISPLAMSRESERRGRSSHLEADVPATATHASESLVVRYSLTALLGESMPWWLKRRYVASLVSDYDEIVATTAQPGERAAGRTHRISVDPPLHGMFLELTQREAFRPWYRTYPLGLVGLVLALLAWSTWLLRAQFRSVERAEAAWRGEAAWRRAMEDSLTIGLRARDMQGRLIYANPSFHELTGYSPEELLGRDPPMPYWPPDSIEATFSRFRRNMRGDAPREGYETRWQRKDGTPVDVMVFEAPLVDAAGSQVGWMGSVIDVTERKRALERERIAAERLAHQARLMSLGEIASSLAHQLNQPLMAIAGYNAGLRNMLQARTDADPRWVAALERQAEQAENAGRIVHRIREFLMRRSPQPERCRLRDIVDDTMNLLGGDLRRRGIEFDVAHAADVPDVHADPVLVGQAIVNLVRNAVDATASQPAAARRIEVRTAQAPGGAAVEVRDHGAGLGGHTLDELATPFFSSKPDGMGLGLAICRSIVEAHAGRLEATDALGGGACFRVTLPAAEISGES